MNELVSIFDATLVHSTLRFAAPLLLAALGGLLCERAGVFNIALEGLMLIGAFSAVVGSYQAGSLAGVAAAMLASGLMAALFAIFSLGLKADEIVVGVALNLLAAGLTVFLLRAMFDVKGAFQDPRIEGLGTLDLPLIADIPLLGPLISGHSWLVYLSFVLAIAMWVWLFRHPLGLRLRGVGEHPEAAASLGVSIRGTRSAAILASGMLCGLAGAQLSLGNVSLFVEGMSAGRGWIAVVAVLLGRAHPGGVAAACLIFGFTDSLGFRLQGHEIPSQFTAMLPFVVTLAGLALIGTRRQKASRGITSHA